MQNGRKIYYDKATGNVITDIGESEGHVRETTEQEDYKSYAVLFDRVPENVGSIRLEYGERINEFMNLGSMKVVNGILIIYPRMTVEVDKRTIQADGIDAATITVNAAGNEVVVFAVGGVEYPQSPLDGVSTFTIDSDLPGIIVVVITTEKYGTASVNIEVI